MGGCHIWYTRYKGASRKTFRPRGEGHIGDCRAKAPKNTTPSSPCKTGGHIRGGGCSVLRRFSSTITYISRGRPESSSHFFESLVPPTHTWHTGSQRAQLVAPNAPEPPKKSSAILYYISCQPYSGGMGIFQFIKRRF